MKRFNQSKIYYVILAIVSISIFAISCKPKPEPPHMGLPDGQGLHDRFIDNRESNKQSFTMDAGTGGTITGTEGTKITFPANAFMRNGNPATGNVEIELIEVYNRAGMLTMNKSSKGVRNNGDEEILQSGGELFINAKQNGDQLTLGAPMHVESAIDEQGDFGKPMTIFRAGDTQDSPDKWEEADEDQDGRPDPATFGEVLVNGVWKIIYVFDTSNFGWTNLDRWYSYTGALTTLKIDVPDGYDDTNCQVFLTYDGEPKALANMDRWDATDQMFTEHFGKLPIGQQVHLILITQIDGELYAKIQGTTIVANHIEVMGDPTQTTQQDLDDAINALP